MALTFLTNKWAQKYNHKVIAITVDHGLRKESAEEASLVHQRLSQKGIPHHILQIQWNKDQSKNQNVYRKLRYEMLQKRCMEEGINYLLTGHNLEDQIETFFQRWAGNSGIDGYCGIPKIQTLSQKPTFYVLRPLLSFPKEKLKDICKTFGEEWIEDPSNQEKVYHRNRIRIALETSVFPKLPKNSIINALNDIREAQNDLESKAFSMLYKYVKIDWNVGFASINLNILNQFDESQIIRFLNKVIELVSGTFRPVRMKQMHTLITQLMINKTKRNIGGVIFEVLEHRMKAYREPNSIREEPITLSLGQTVIWDNRFEISYHERKNFNPKIQSLSKEIPRTVLIVGNKDRAWIREQVEHMDISDHKKQKLYKIISYPHLSNKVAKTLPVVVSPEGNLLSIPNISLYFDPSLKFSSKFVICDEKISSVLKYR